MFKSLIRLIPKSKLLNKAKTSLSIFLICCISLSVTLYIRREGEEEEEDGGVEEGVGGEVDSRVGEEVGERGEVGGEGEDCSTSARMSENLSRRCWWRGEVNGEKRGKEEGEVGRRGNKPLNQIEHLEGFDNISLEEGKRPLSSFVLFLIFLNDAPPFLYKRNTPRLPLHHLKKQRKKKRKKKEREKEEGSLEWIPLPQMDIRKKQTLKQTQTPLLALDSLPLSLPVSLVSSFLLFLFLPSESKHLQPQ